MKIILFLLLMVGIFALIVGISAFLAWLVWLAWTYVAVAAFHAPSLTYLQCWIGMIAVNILLSAARAAASKKS